MSNKNVIKVQCIKCKTETNHKIIAEKKKSEFIEGADITLCRTNQMIQCKGCEEISFRKLFSHSDFYTGELVENENLYPSRTKDRIAVKGEEFFPLNIRNIYLETLKTFNCGAHILTAIWLRAIIESICIEQSIAGKNLQEKIDKLGCSGLLSKKQAEFFHVHRFMGNEAAHEMKKPRLNELIVAMDIIETLLKTIFILPKLVSQMGMDRREKNISSQ